MNKKLIIAETTPQAGDDVAFYDAYFYGGAESKTLEIMYSDTGGMWTKPGEMAARLTTDGDYVVLTLASSESTEVVMRLDYAEIELVGMLYNLYNRLMKRPADRTKLDLFEEFEDEL